MTEIELTNGGETQAFRLEPEAPGIWLNDEFFTPEELRADERTRRVVIQNRVFDLVFQEYDARANTLRLLVNGKEATLNIRTAYDRMLEQIGLDRASAHQLTDLKAPMPGLVRKIFVEAGQEVAADEPLMTLEAMKMENVLKAPTPVRVGEIVVTSGASVDKNQVLITFA